MLVNQKNAFTFCFEKTKQKNEKCAMEKKKIARKIFLVD